MDTDIGKVLDRLPERGENITKYPWHAWRDGQVYELTFGVHFTCTLKTFASVCSNHAKKRGHCFETRKIDDVTIAIKYVNNKPPRRLPGRPPEAP